MGPEPICLVPSGAGEAWAQVHGVDAKGTCGRLQAKDRGLEQILLHGPKRSPPRTSSLQSLRPSVSEVQQPRLWCLSRQPELTDLAMYISSANPGEW